MLTLTARSLKRAAWSEYKITADYQGRLGEVARATDYPPGGFVAVELGFAIGEGPSLLFALQKPRMVPARSGKRLTGARAQRLARRLVAAAGRAGDE